MSTFIKAIILLATAAALGYGLFSSNECVKTLALVTTFSDGTLSSSSNENKPNFEVAREESLGFFTDVSEEEWKLMQEKARATQPNTLGNPLKGSQHPGFWFQNHYEPDFNCRHERRIGRLGDGGKWVCDPHRISRENCLVYSVGSNGEASFEAAIQREIGRHCEIHVFDFGDYAATVTRQAPGVHYHQWGIGESDASGKFKTLNETVYELGHVNRTVDIFKIDCEGCELTSYNDWLGAPVTLRQIQVEIHSKSHSAIDNPATMNFFHRMYEEGYVIFHKEPNIAFWGGQWGLKCVEYAFLKLRKDFVGV